MDDKQIAFKGEFMLLNWGETNTRGRTVTFQLDDEGEEHPFRHMTVKQGKKAGQRFMAVLVQLDDDEQPMEKTAAQMAYLFCNDPQFWEWCNERSIDSITNPEAARNYVLSMLTGALGKGHQPVTSRSELDTRPAVRAAWEHLIARPFTSWRDARNNVPATV